MGCDYVRLPGGEVAIVCSRGRRRQKPKPAGDAPRFQTARKSPPRPANRATVGCAEADCLAAGRCLCGTFR